MVTVRRLCHRIPFLESLFLVFHSKIPTSLYIHLKKGLKGIHEIMMSESVKQATILFYSENRERERERERERANPGDCPYVLPYKSSLKYEKSVNFLPLPRT